MLTTVRANQVLDAIHAVTTLLFPTAPIHVRYMTTVGSAATAGTELATSGGYTSGAGAPTVTWGAAASGSAATSTAVTTTNMPATTINGIELWDSAGSPTRQELGNLTAPKTTASGDTLSFAIGAITDAIT